MKKILLFLLFIFVGTTKPMENILDDGFPSAIKLYDATNENNFQIILPMIIQIKKQPDNIRSEIISNDYFFKAFRLVKDKRSWIIALTMFKMIYEISPNKLNSDLFLILLEAAGSFFPNKNKKYFTDICEIINKLDSDSKTFIKIVSSERFIEILHNYNYKSNNFKTLLEMVNKLDSDGKPFIKIVSSERFIEISYFILYHNRYQDLKDIFKTISKLKLSNLVYKDNFMGPLRKILNFTGKKDKEYNNCFIFLLSFIIENIEKKYFINTLKETLEYCEPCNLKFKNRNNQFKNRSYYTDNYSSESLSLPSRRYRRSKKHNKETITRKKCKNCNNMGRSSKFIGMLERNIPDYTAFKLSKKLSFFLEIFNDKLKKRINELTKTLEFEQESEYSDKENKIFIDFSYDDLEEILKKVLKINSTERAFRTSRMHKSDHEGRIEYLQEKLELEKNRKKSENNNTDICRIKMLGNKTNTFKLFGSLN